MSVSNGHGGEALAQHLWLVRLTVLLSALPKVQLVFQDNYGII